MIGCHSLSNFKSSPHTFALIPNIGQWRFQWLAHRAVPMLHSAEVTNEIELMLFDEDDNEISDFSNVPGLYQKARKRICCFHYVTLKLQSLYRNLRQSRNEPGVTVVNKIEAICNVISDDVETEEEYKLLYNMAKIWIEGASADGYITTFHCS